MTILFSNPPWFENEAGILRRGIRAGSRWPFTHRAIHEPGKFIFGSYLPYPFFMGYAASYTQRELPDSKVVFRDSIARGESYNSFFSYLETLKPDFIVIETATPSWEHDQRVLRVFEKRLPATRVILAGPIDCAKSDAIFDENRNVCAIVQGEYDKHIALVMSLTGQGPHPLRTVLRHNLLTTSEMNAAPLPMWDEGCEFNYWDACPVGHEPPQLQIWTSRGCPFKCSFCVWPATMTGNDPDGTKPRAVRCYSPEYMAAFLMERITRAQACGRPYRSIYLDDDTANLIDKHTVAMCGVLAKAGLPWSAMCRADTSSREVWQLMKDSGCFGVKIGFESGSQHVVDNIIGKRLDLKEAEDTAKFLRSIGMTVHGTFTVGLPGETDEQRHETHTFIRRLMSEGTLNTHQLSGSAEIDGTPLHSLRKAGHLDKYPGAHIDADYHPSTDGQRKVEEMRR